MCGVEDPNGVCVLWESSTPYLYMLEVGLAGDILGNHAQPALHGIDEPLERGGVERGWGRCRRTLGCHVRPHLALVGSWLGLDGSHAGAPAKCRWAFPFIPFAHLCFTHSILCLLFCFPLVFEYESCKTYFSNTSGTRSIVKAYPSKDYLFLPFWTLFCGRI